MILADTGPLVALFDPADGDHRRCRACLSSLDQAILTTDPVLTEAFHLLTPGSHGARRLMDFVAERGLVLWHMDDANVMRAFSLMEAYQDLPMDFADASLVVAGEALSIRSVFTLDRKDFGVYRMRRGHRMVAFDVIAC